MLGEETSVAKAVRETVLSRPGIKECLILDVVNYSALARDLLKEFEKKGTNASVGSVKMALMRTGEELRKERILLEKRVKSVLAKTVIEVQSDLTVVTCRKRSVLNELDRISKIMESSRFFQLTQGVETFTIVVSSKESKEIVKALGRENTVDLIEEQTAIILISPEEIIQTPGVVSFVTSALSSEGMNITQVISCYNDTIFVFDRKDAQKSYQVIEELILAMRS